MTSEVALMNRTGVVLAADSAATVRYWDSKTQKREQRYFKRANKIFNLSSIHPVGLLVYGTGSLQGMPWDVLVKAYRERRGTQNHNYLPGFAADLFKFLAANRDIFPRDYQDQSFAAAVGDWTTEAATEILLSDEVKNADDPLVKAGLIENALQTREQAVTNDAYISDAARTVHNDVVARLLDGIIATYQAGHMGQILADMINVPRVVRLAAEATLKKGSTKLDTTGIVIAGYGRKQYLPQLEHFNCYAVFRNKLIFERLEDDCTSIRHDNTSEIVPLAQSDMIDTFRLGADVSTLVNIDRRVSQALDEFAQALVDAGHVPAGVDMTPFHQTATNQFKERLRDYLWEHHSTPLRRVIGMLSPEELAELAETFVSMESLKERVTRPTETVGGPVDVAIITKGDGFIWVKRKHYFDPALNPRYVAKTAKEVEVGT